MHVRISTLCVLYNTNLAFIVFMQIRKGIAGLHHHVRDLLLGEQRGDWCQAQRRVADYGFEENPEGRGHESGSSEAADAAPSDECAS